MCINLPAGSMGHVHEGLDKHGNRAESPQREEPPMSTTAQFLELPKLLHLPTLAIAMAASLVTKVARSTSAAQPMVTTERGPGFGTPMHFLTKNQAR
jgi:hypothetical protein